MQNNTAYAIHSDDYSQSANVLFHFMTKIEFLTDIILNQTISPRYHYENIEYLNINVKGKQFSNIAIIQKCFCDIPISKVTTAFNLKGEGDNFKNLNENEKRRAEERNTHTDFYGDFGIGLSKKWGEENNLQPIHYINPHSTYAISLRELIEKLLQSDDMFDEMSNDMLNRLSFIKPIRGTMPKNFTCDDHTDIKIVFRKNFHDEKEWRYVPNIQTLEKLDLYPVIANPNVLAHDLNLLNNNIMVDRYDNLRLKFNVNDIRYIIVPDKLSRMNIINEIRKNFTGDEKYIMISKIFVLEDIRRDW